MIAEQFIADKKSQFAWKPSIKLSVLALVVGFFMLAANRGDEHLDRVVCIVIGIFYVGYLADAVGKSTPSWASLPLGVGCTLRVGLLFYALYTDNPFHLPNIGFASDAGGYYSGAVAFSQGSGAGRWGLFSQIVGTIFRFTGATHLLGCFIVSLFSLVAIHICLRALYELPISDSQRRSGLWFMCIAPNYALLSVTFWRETAISACVAASLLFFIRWFLRGREERYVLAIVFALAASAFHGAVGMLVPGYLLVRILYNPSSESFRLDARSILVAIIGAVAFAFVFSRFTGVLFGKLSGIDSVNDAVNMNDSAGSSYVRYVGGGGIAGMTIYAPLRIVYFLFSPFIWQWRGLSDIFAAAFGSLPIMLSVGRGVRFASLKGESKQRKIAAALLLAFCVALYVFAMGTSNTGTATRHRDKFIALYALLFALCPFKKDAERDAQVQIDSVSS